jgi:hypothetical protein
MLKFQVGEAAICEARGARLPTIPIEIYTLHVNSSVLFLIRSHSYMIFAVCVH